MRCKVRGVLMTLLIAWLAPSFAWADGGTVRCSELQGGRRVTVFTAPPTLRAGLVDVSVLVQDAESGTPLLDVPICVTAYPVDQPERRTSMPATALAATNQLLRAASMHFSEPGWWRVEVVVQGPAPPQAIGFDVEVADAPPPWLDLSLWIGWPLLAIGLFAVHQWLVRRRSHFV
jgi:hypothetical protein